MLTVKVYLTLKKEISILPFKLLIGELAQLVRAEES